MAKIHLQIADGPVREILLAKQRFTIGRAPHNDLVIDHFGVSSAHAVIVCSGHEIFLEDLGSTNGTKVNGQPVRKHFLQGGDIIELAKFKIRFAADGEDTSNDIHAPHSTISVSVQALYQEPNGQNDTHFLLNTTTATLPTAVIRVLNGASAGKQVTLTKGLTTIGRPGLQVAAITNGVHGYHIIHVEGAPYPLVNGDSIGERIYALTYDDVLDMSGTRILFCRDEI